tara:strand:+ start:239 stop:508 length:270 start_codon:yes stop_codon:yes gene_type:complete
MKVYNITNNNGNKVANQFIIDDKNKETFQSYDSIIAVRSKKTDKITLDSYFWDYSVTTGKYRNQFLGEGINETRKKIKNGTYKLRNLNK